MAIMFCTLFAVMRYPSGGEMVERRPGPMQFTEIR